MRRAAYMAVALLLHGGAVFAQSEGWQADQDGQNFACFNVGSFSANNLTPGGATYSTQGTGEIVNGNPYGSVAAWFVDPVAGVDSGACTTSATACHSLQEINRRWTGANLTANSTVTVLGNLASSDTGQWSFTTNPGVSVTFIGSTGSVTGFAGRAIDNTIHTGTVTAFSAAGLVPAADDIEMTDSGLPTSFTASGLLASGVLFFDVTAGNLWWWAAKDLGSKTIRISAPGDTPGPTGMNASLTVGHTYTTYQLWTMPAQNFGVGRMTGSGVATVIVDRIQDNGTRSMGLGALGLGWATLQRRTWTGPTGKLLNIYAMINCVIETTGGTVSSPQQVPVNITGGMWKGNGSASLSFFGELGVATVVMQGAGMTTNDWAYMTLEGGVAAFDLSIPALNAVSHSAIQFNGASFLSGMGNSSKLVFSDNNSQIGIGGVVSSSPTAFPPFVAASTSDASPVQLGGTSYAVSAIPATGNVLLSPATTYPSTVFLKGTPATRATWDAISPGQCLVLDGTGTLIQGTSCSAGSGTVTSVTGTAQRISVVNPTTTPIVDTIGGYYSGAVSGGNEDLGTTLTNGLVCDTTTAGIAVLRTCTSGTDYPAVGVATPGSCTNCSATVNANGQVTTYSSGTAPVTSIGVTPPITSTGGATPTIGISLPAGQVAFGTGTNVTSSPKFIVDTATFSPDTHVEVSGRIQAGIGSTGGDVLGVAGSTFAGGFQIWKDFTPSKAMNIGLAVPGGAVGNNLVIAGYTGSAWGEVCEFENVGGMACKNVVAPGTPASGFGAIYIDSTSKNLTVINDAGTVNHGAQTHTAAAGKAFTALADTGAWTETSFQAPITPTACGATTFGTSISSAGAISCTQPAFTDLSGSWACSQRPAASAPGGGNDVNNSSGSCVSTVVAIHDASVTQLVFGTIPDSNPQSTVLIRGAGSTSISGVAASVIADTVTKHDYFINIQSLQPVDTSTRYLATSSSGTVLPGGVIESPNDFLAGHVGYKFYIIDSIGTASSMDCWVTLNGTLITGTDYNFTPGTTSPGVHTQATVATGSASASDTFGMACLYNGNFVTGPFGATIVFTVQMVLTP